MLRMDPHVENFSEFCHTFRRFHTIDIPYNIGFPTGVVNAGRALSRILCVYVCDGGGWGDGGGEGHKSVHQRRIVGLKRFCIFQCCFINK